MQSGQMKIVKDGDTVHVMPEMKLEKTSINSLVRQTKQ